MTELEKAARQALEVLENLQGIDTETECVTIDVQDEIDALRRALEQPAQDGSQWTGLKTPLNTPLRLQRPAQPYDYRIKYDRGCYKCQSHFCPGNCKEPEQPAQQELVGSLSVRYYLGSKAMTNTSFDYYGDLPEGDYELYTRPPARKWAGLTDEQIKECWEQSLSEEGPFRDFRKFARAIEAAHGIGEKK